MVGRNAYSFLSFTVFVAFLMSGCYLFGDDAHEEVGLTKGFYMNWFIDPAYRHIVLSRDNPTSGIVVVRDAVVAAGYNDEFIIAMQHPNLSDTIEKRLFIRDSVTGDYQLLDPADSVYLWEGDSLYERDGRWYHISNGSAIPDSLRPHKGITNYFVVDLRGYEEGDRDGYLVHQASNETDFLLLRSRLKVPEDLVFSFVDTTLR